MLHQRKQQVDIPLLFFFFSFNLLGQKVNYSNNIWLLSALAWLLRLLKTLQTQKEGGCASTKHFVMQHGAAAERKSGNETEAWRQNSLGSCIIK